MAASSIKILTLSIRASAVLGRNRAVTAAGAVPAAGAACLGFTDVAAVIGERVSVAVMGTSIAEAGGAFAVGAALELDGSGRVVARSTGVIVAHALAAASAAGSMVEVLVIRGTQAGGAQAVAPDAPTIGAATAANATVSAAYTAPGSNGGAPVTSYDGFLTDTDGNVIATLTGVPNPVVFTAAQGVVNGTAYKVAVRANNSAGPGPLSAFSNVVTPVSQGTPAFQNKGTMRIVGTQAQVLAPAPVTFTQGMASRIIKIQAPGAAIGCRVSVYNLSPVMGVSYVKASAAATDVAAVDTLANAYNAYANGVTHNVTAGADPLGFRKATWGGATQSRRLEPTDAVLPSFGYNNQQDCVTSDPILGLVPKRAVDRVNEEYYYLVRLTIGLVKDYDGLCTPVTGAVTGPIAEYTSSNGADSVLWHGGDLGLVDGVDGAYGIPAAISPQAMPVMAIEWIYPEGTQATTLAHVGDSVTEGYGWPRIAVNRKSSPARPLHHVNLGGSTTRTGSFLGNMYLYLQSNAKPDYMVMPIISINNYSPLSDFTLSAAQAEMTRLQEVEAFLTALGIRLIWWTPFNFGANPAPSDTTSAWGYLYNTAKAYAATKGIEFMDINGDPRMVRSVYNASTNPTGWIAPDNTHPSNPAGIQGFAAVYGDRLTAMGF